MKNRKEQLNNLRIKCRGLLKDDGYFYSHGWWRHYYEGQGLPLTNREQHTNDTGGYTVNTSSELAVFQLATGSPDRLTCWGFSLDESFLMLDLAYEEYLGMDTFIHDSFYKWSHDRGWKLESDRVKPLWMVYRARKIRLGCFTPSPADLSIPVLKDAWNAYIASE